MQAQLTIGDFSRITHLSVKTLRYYHQVGLLDPDDVNQSTGYRYYRVDQVQAAHTIRRLRDLDMPVDEVRAVLQAPDATTRDALLAAHLDRMQAQLVQTQAAVASLRDLLKRPKLSIEVEFRDTPATPALAIRQTVERAGLVDWWAGAIAELHRAPGVRLGPAGGVFDNALFTDERGEALVFIPIAEPPASLGRARAFTVPATRLAVTVHHGSHDDADRTYGALGAYIAEHHMGTAGPVREYYLSGSDDTTDVTRWRTEICWEL